MKQNTFILKWKFKEYLFNFIQVFFFFKNLFEFHILFNCREKRKVYELYETHLISVVSKLELRKIVYTFTPIGPYDTTKLQGSDNSKF